VNLFPKKRLPAALLATHVPEVLASLPLDLFQTREAISTRGITSALYASPVLVIADLDNVIECGGISRAEMKTAFESMSADGVVVVTSKQFMDEPQRWTGEALMASGLRTGIRYMPPRVVLVTNYCGGVGKTTLALALARQFRRSSGLATALIEVGVGGSSLDARIGKHPSLYTVITQSESPQTWENVDVFPSDTWGADSLASDNRFQKALQDIIGQHTMTVFDTFPANPLWKYCIELATDVLVIAAPRADAIAQTETVMRLLAEETASLTPKPRIHLILNQVRTAGERIQMAGVSNAWVGYDERKAEALDGRLADSLLKLLYTGWKRRKNKKNKKAPKEDKA